MVQTLIIHEINIVAGQVEARRQILSARIRRGVGERTLVSMIGDVVLKKLELVSQKIRSLSLRKQKLNLKIKIIRLAPIIALKGILPPTKRIVLGDPWEGSLLKGYLLEMIII